MRWRSCLLAALVLASVGVVSFAGAVDDTLYLGGVRLEAMQQDSAALQFRFALDPRTGASMAERVRAYTLLGIAELAAGHRQPATRAFREALALDPGVRVDSLADLHPDLLSTFDAERAALATRERYLALEVAGRRYNIGVKYGLLQAQLALALEGRDQAEVLADLVELLAARQK